MSDVATPRYDPGMSPNVPKTPARQIRISTERWDAARRATEAAHTDRAKLVNELFAWYLREPGAKLPRRPEREEWEA